MHPIEISLREGFRDDEVVIRVDRAVASSLKAVTTKALVGLAQRQIVQATKLPATVEVSLPRRGLSKTIETSAPFLDVDAMGGVIAIKESRERHGEM